jgi:uncharacterized membrane protein YcgQ (UPF0703/DUF1980 family)
MKKIILLAAIILSACVGSTAVPSPTSEPTKTIAPSFTPTATPSSTATNTATLTATPSPTETQQPPATLTAIAKGLTKTVIAANITATASKAQWIKTSTAGARYATATEIGKYKVMDWRELINYPKKHKGEFIKIHGQVFNIVNSNQFQMFVGNFEGVYVVAKDELSGLYEDMWVWVYGKIGDVYCFTNAYNAEVCQPVLEDAFWSINQI